EAVASLPLLLVDPLTDHAVVRVVLRFPLDLSLLDRLRQVADIGQDCVPDPVPLLGGEPHLHIPRYVAADEHEPDEHHAAPERPPQRLVVVDGAIQAPADEPEVEGVHCQDKRPVLLCHAFAPCSRYADRIVAMDSRSLRPASTAAGMSRLCASSSGAPSSHMDRAAQRRQLDRFPSCAVRTASTRPPNPAWPG